MPVVHKPVVHNRLHSSKAALMTKKNNEILVKAKKVFEHNKKSSLNKKGKEVAENA